MMDENKKAAAPNAGLGQLPAPDLHEGITLRDGGKYAGTEDGYTAETVLRLLAAERERWRTASAAALEWMEGAWLRIDGEWGPSGKTLDQECADGDEPEIAALRALLRA